MAFGTDSANCLYLDSMWEQAMVNGKLIAYIPATQFKFLKYLVMSLRNTVLDSVDSALRGLDKQVQQFKSEPTDPAVNEKEKLCRALFECKAALEYMVPKDPAKDPPVVRALIPNSEMRDNLRGYIYDNEEATDEVITFFDNFYCKLSVSTLMDSMLSELALYLYAALTELDRRLKPLLDLIDKAIQTYMEAIQPFLDFLDSLDKFKGCAMALCDYANTSKNYTDDSSKKAYVGKTGDTWVFSSVDFIEKFYTDHADAVSKIQNNKKILSQWIETKCSPDVVSKKDQITATTGSYGKSFI